MRTRSRASLILLPLTLLFLLLAPMACSSDDADMQGGDMPAHGHGLPTAPQVTEELGNGEYRVEGIKFQMGGYWEIYVDFTTSDGQADTIMMPLDLQ